MLDLPNFAKLDWGSCLLSNAYTLSKKFGALIHSITFPFSESWSLRYFGCRYEGIIQKKYGRIVFFFLFFFSAWGMGGAVTPPGGPGRCPGGGEAPDFYFIFFVQNTLKRWSLGDYRVENISNHSVVTLNNVILTFSTIIKLSLRNRQREK